MSAYNSPSLAPYLFERNPTVILPNARQPGPFAAHARQSVGILPQKEPAASKYPPRSALRSAHPQELGAYLPLPSLKLSRIDELRCSAPLEPLLAVIVSPHYETPTAQRDRAPPVAKKQHTKPAPARSELDGNSGAEHSVVPNRTPMTSNTIGSKREEMGHPFPLKTQRPSIVSHHSNSVPSTPVQVARKYESRSRSPSPNGGLGSHSPRSTVSETNSTMPPRRPGNRAFRCEYETNAAFGRRRIPYHSSDLLEKAKEEPKKTLDPEEEKKLTGDMRAMYDRLQPTKENTQRRDQFVKKLQNILEKEFPGNEFKVHVFGSSGNMLYTSESDVDICIQTPMVKLEEMHGLAAALAKHGMEKVVCIPQAKVRIVKVWDPALNLHCDMNVNNTLALENTRMIKTYVQIDERVRQLAMIVKYWTKQRILNDAALGGTISSYTWICMILNFLQTRDPPIIPSLHKLPHKAVDPSTGKAKSDFADDLSKLVGFGENNQESLGQLLFHFFRRYGHEVDYESHVISVRQGCLLKREEKNWHLAGLQKEARNRLCVEEPFNTERNLGNSADEFAWRGIHLELRRAFDLLADGQQLEKACEQFEFPPEEKSATPLFKKPQSTKPTLTSSVPSRGGRGGHRGGRGNYQKGGSGNYGRRASSGAFNRPPFSLHSPPVGAMPMQQDYFGREPPRGLNEQLHHELYQQYQMLEMQSNTLRQQLAARERAQQAHQVQAAHMHAQAVAAHAQAQHNRGPSSTSGSPQKSPYINGRSSPRLPEAGLQPNPFPPGFIYHYPAAFFDPSQASAALAQDGSRTNPSSPSLTNSVPGLRRQVHRASNASETNTLRSHSQPPRGPPPQAIIQGYPPMPQYYDPAQFAGYPIARSTQEVSTSASGTEAQSSTLPNYPEVIAPPDHGTPKEYVGYSYEQLPARSLQEYSVSAIPSFNELAQRRRRVSPEITQPLLTSALRRVSRSPSPLGGHMRSYSSNVALPSGAVAESRKDRTDSARPPPVESGPMIVNGSFPTQSRDSRTRSDTVDALPLMDAGGSTALGIFVNGDQYRMITPEEREQLVVEEMQRQQKLKHKLEPAIVNGSVNEAVPVDMSGLVRVGNGHRQAYPVLPDGWMNYNLSNGGTVERSEEVSPTRVPHPQWKAPPSAYTNGLTSLDTTNTPQAPSQEAKSATLPVLSPVFETRTPSPTTNRQPNVNKHSNNGKAQLKENHTHPRRGTHSPGQASAPKENRNTPQKGNSQANDKNNRSNGGNNNAGAWQQSGSRKKKKNKNGNKANENKATGEPLPANAADRKGG
ncbi:hypothetical protein P280DRAFT_71772 [Massarina eburnea CBS 473.64]|uniref:polynucleotide adenylyltransferase n=1 Tax=Massarina eburnea CBS 473.64 TaxID=1395130 RepID=A0A6A6RU29_9PLEO|nr:hypothetical protein P280DRAFT_71772 [Massarina eburnea CBS 473.64]